jgi:subtilisin family serine protease
MNDGPVRASSTVGLGSSALRELVEGSRGGSAIPVTSDGKVRVEVAHDLGVEGIGRVIAAFGASRVRPVGDHLAEAMVPVKRLVAVESTPGVRFLRPPLVSGDADYRASGAAAAVRTGQEVRKTNASNWHTAGLTGRGAKVGIIDRWAQAKLAAAIDAGEVPSPSGRFCINYGVACDFATQSPSAHGVCVAEVIHEMAPAARLYLARTGTSSVADLQAAVNYFASQGVRVISRSETSELDGPGNGTGPTADVIANAVSRGMVWVQSAGNAAGAGDDAGSYWRGGWYDPEADGWLNFSGSDELLDFHCAFVNGFRWSDWGAARTDYDIYVFDDPGATILKAKSEDNQPAGMPPLEHVSSKGLTCNGDSDTDYLAVKLYAAGAGTAGDILEFMTNGSFVQYWSNPYSATQPAADTASPGGLAVGAVDPALGTSIASYSAQGPTNDGRVKPDLAAASCVRSFTYAPDCFSGTSAAAPVVAGAAALVIGAAPNWSPAEVKSYLLRSTVDRGAAGVDYAFGEGELRLATIPDKIRPSARAFAAHGRHGLRVRLRYRVSDNSGRTRERVNVYQSARRIRTIRTRLGESGTYFVPWRAPVTGSGFRFCVRAFDARGNASRLSCAGIRLR